jgi:hypothetical protein
VVAKKVVVKVSVVESDSDSGVDEEHEKEKSTALKQAAAYFKHVDAFVLDVEECTVRQVNHFQQEVEELSVGIEDFVNVISPEQSVHVDLGEQMAEHFEECAALPSHEEGLSAAVPEPDVVIAEVEKVKKTKTENQKKKQKKAVAAKKKKNAAKLPTESDNTAIVAEVVQHDVVSGVQSDHLFAQKVSSGDIAAVIAEKVCTPQKQTVDKESELGLAVDTTTISVQAVEPATTTTTTPVQIVESSVVMQCYPVQQTVSNDLQLNDIDSNDQQNNCLSASSPVVDVSPQAVSPLVALPIVHAEAFIANPGSDEKLKKKKKKKKKTTPAASAVVEEKHTVAETPMPPRKENVHIRKKTNNIKKMQDENKAQPIVIREVKVCINCLLLIFNG